jgi:DNA-binding response OmpR family regulator
MDRLDILEGKRILIVDDEPDILETLEELLDVCKTDLASSFESAVSFLKKNTYDAAILDIMGVKGYSLLEITHKLEIPSIMLTAHALTPDNLKRSLEQGADAYVPKDKMVDLCQFLSDVILAREQGKKAHLNWFSMLNPLFDKLFGEGWQDSDQTFWDKFDEKHPNKEKS